jgi:uncharacterized protein HemX
MVCGLLGCTVGTQDDGTFGINVGLSEEQHEKVGQAIEGAAGVAGAASSLFPALLPIATLLGGGGVVWRKMKKTVTKQRAPLEMLVQSLETLKEQDAEAWAKVEDNIKKQYPSLEIKATIEETLAELKKQGNLATT